jgi:segregation and condensation protein B
MSDRPLFLVLEAVLLAAGRPVSVEQLRELFDEPRRPAAEEILGALAELGDHCADRAYELCEVGSGWRLQVRAEHAEVVSRLWQERPSRYSRALLETLALIAYRQPITRGEIEDIRGVTVSSTIMRTLQERNWIRVVGHREVPGRPELLGTTREFLDYFGLRSLDDLPTLAELRDLDDIKVQLEFPGGEGPAEVLPAPAQDLSDESDDDAAREDEESDGSTAPGSPSLVASPPRSSEH